MGLALYKEPQITDEDGGYIDRLPYSPWCSNDVEKYGIHRRRRPFALKHSHIQHNPDALCNSLVFDIDQPTGAMQWELTGAPAPNYAVQNPVNGHAHLIYLLAVGICKTPNGRKEPVRYAAAVERTLAVRLAADAAYAGLISKNPFHPAWRVTRWRNDPYTLDELAEYCPDGLLHTPAAEMPRVGLSRNCDLFDALRKWAYRAIRQGWPTFEQWTAAVLQRAEMVNIQQNPTAPLPFSEVKATAKSVAKYTHANFSAAAFSEAQAKRGRKATNQADIAAAGGVASGQARLFASQDKREQAAELAAAGMKQAEIAALLGVHRDTLRRWAKA